MYCVIIKIEIYTQQVELHYSSGLLQSSFPDHKSNRGVNRER